MSLPSPSRPRATSPSAALTTVDTVSEDLDGDNMPVVFSGVAVCLAVRGATEADARIPGMLHATSYALTFNPLQPVPETLRHLPSGFFSVPCQLIARLEVRRQQLQPRSTSGSAVARAGPADSPLPAASALLDVTAKDARSLLLTFDDVETCESVVARLRMLAFPVRPDIHLAAFSQPPPSPLVSGCDPRPQVGWDAYDAMAELRRMGVLEPRSDSRGWRVSTLNAAYGLCESYPAVLAFPRACPDALLEAAAQFRAKGRLPALSWRHPSQGCTLWRSSQPLVGFLGGTNVADEALLRAVRAANSPSHETSQPLLIADCRPLLNAVANHAGGGGFERYDFCVSAVRISIVCAPSNGRPSLNSPSSTWACPTYTRFERHMDAS